MIVHLVDKDVKANNEYAPSGANKAVVELKEIQKAAQEYQDKYQGYFNYEYYYYDKACFMDGALWMKDKLNGE